MKIKKDLKNGFGEYISKPFQNIFDIAIEVHGDIEGVADLLINNPNLDINQDIESGTVIKFTNAISLNETVLDYIDATSEVTANHQSNIYPKYSDMPVVMDILIKKDEYSFSFSKTEGDMVIDWGDDTDLEYVDKDVKKVTHSYMVSAVNDSSDFIRVRIYSDTDSLGDLMIESHNASVILMYKNIKVKKYHDNSEIVNPIFISLMGGLRDVCLGNVMSNDLGFIGKIESLRRIDIQSKYTTAESIDNLFLNIIDNYSSNRLPANISIKVKPNGVYEQPKNNIPKNGMEAVWMLVNSDEWNSEAYQWVIKIDGVNYEKVNKEEVEL